MATLSQVLDEIVNGFWIDGDDLQPVLKGFERMVREYGVNQIYVFECSMGAVDYDMMGESTEWEELFKQDPDQFHEFTTPELYEEGFIIGENMMYVYINSLD